MWLFHKTTVLSRSGLLKGMVDCHSHLLPGVDDGVQSMEESLQILREMEQQGIRRVWLTPHIMEDIPNETLALQRKFRELLQQYRGAVELKLAAEYMLDNLFEERLERGFASFGRRKTFFVGGDLLLQPSDGSFVRSATHSKERLLSFAGTSGTV